MGDFESERERERERSNSFWKISVAPSERNFVERRRTLFVVVRAFLRLSKKTFEKRGLKKKVF